jgi:cytochrome P450
MTDSTLPPGLHNKLLNPILYLLGPYRFYEKVFARFGDTFLFVSPNGPVAVTRDPEHVKVIFTLDTSQIEIYPDNDGPEFIVGKNSVLLMTDDPHRRERRLLSPPFHGARMRSYAQVMQQATRDEMKSWSAGQVVDFQLAMQRISLSVIAQAVFGLSDPEDVRRTQQLSADYMNSLNPLMLFFPLLRKEYFGRSLFPKTVNARRDLEQLLMEQIQRCRARPQSEDILSMMVHARYDDGSVMSDEQIRDELFTLMLAGHETTALGLSWMFYHLYHNPETLVRLRQELATLGTSTDAESIAQCRYLDACASESLRLYPVVAETFRRLRVPIQLGPYTIPAGYAVSVSAIGVHHNPAIYPQSYQFRPERFLERKFTPFEFVSFGGGTRRCIGAAFAQYEMKLVAYEILRHCELTPANTRPILPVMRGPTFGPKGGVPMQIVRRIP